ncbi:LacI family DNA-binding transcriptional regulator [Rhizobium sp. S152]|uniref:LacI family DNA-binding transcriptional regulator n=1 Tax=Rhizobium sp. S152 TaxID=3055038 RepID=UPI0025A9EB86|nr:LacI family DNA-binding transcriptional regulator [Rhizobium sp. S152]MDM9629046.1 LacI family DNA-binding transcriptional regulator [Rhizobium sp. S152]
MNRRKTEKASARPTMSDVAKLAGVSQATVSMVLNGTGGTRVTEKTRMLVRAAAKQLGYRVWMRASVGSGGLQAIGFIIDDSTSNPIVNKAIDAARQIAWENGAVLVVLPTQNDERLRTAALELLFAHRVVGVVFAAFFTREYSLPQKLSSVPVVLINCHTKGDIAPAILPAHTLGAETAVRHLTTAGHKRIAFINGESWMEASKDRLRGYRRGLKTAGIGFDARLVRSGNWTLSGGRECTIKLLALPEPPTAIFCASDEMAIGCYEAIKEAGLTIPGDISVIGFDDITSSRHLEPPLTTILVPHDDMGRRAITHLFAKRDSDRQSEIITGRLQIDCPLLERASVGPPNGIATS